MHHQSDLVSPSCNDRKDIVNFPFARGKLIPVEKNYSVIELEALAVMGAFKHFIEIILGYDIHFLTDHHPLTYILLDSRHIKGSQAGRVDTLLAYNSKITGLD